MKNAPTVETALKTLLEWIQDERLILPEIQRDFVWTRKSVLYLFDSLFRELPIGHMLVWKAKQSVQVKGFHHRKLRRGHALENFEGYLLDGQQRLTALDRVRDADDDYPLMFCVWPECERDGFDKFTWRKDWNADSEWYVRVSDVLDEHFDVMAFMRSNLLRLKKEVLRGS